MENSQAVEEEPGMKLGLSETNVVISDELHALGRLFEMEGMESKRCVDVLEHVNLNFGENGKTLKKRRIEDVVVILGDNGEESALNGV